MHKLPNPGDRVRVPFGIGIHILEGEVLRASDFGIGPLVMVAVDVEGSDEPINVTYDLDDVEIASVA
ncbi:MAG: hypothetical protein JOZ47_20335 [Kutzneria sp.]|nr:hypothetical protein [Kutzneria sp.]